MFIKEITYNIVTDLLQQAIKDGKLPDDVEYPDCKVEYPKDQKFGDSSTSIALESAKILRRSPMDIGEILKSSIEHSVFKDKIDKVEVVKPGFINFFLSFDYLCTVLDDIIANRERYGRTVKRNPQKICIEFVSANPTGPLNVVSARAAAIGDTIANLLEARGDTVEREFYVNDYGNQVNLLGKSVLARLKESRGEPSDFPDEGYQGEYIKDIAKYINDNFTSEFENINDEESQVDFMAKKAVDFNVSTQRNDLNDFSVKYKTWFSERSLHESAEVNKTLEFLESKDVIYTEDNKKVFRSTDYGDDKDRVVVRDDSRPTYLLADIAYHRNKIKRGYDKIINIWGPDHHGYIARLTGAMEVMNFGKDKFRILIAQQVNLVMEGEAVKMSKRLGNFSTMRDLIDEIGVNVARYFFIMRSLESHLDFDLTLAKKESSENPVFYLQYAHARICSIFREAEKRSAVYNPKNFNRDYLNTSESIRLLKFLMKFPEEVDDAAENCEPHTVANFLLKLAQAFHKFYTEHRILSDDKEMTNTFLALSDSVRIVLKNGLELLGVSAPESM